MIEGLTWTVAAIALAAFGSGLLRLGFGIGAGVLFAPILTLVLNSPARALATMAPLHWVANIQGAIFFRNHWKWNEVVPFMAGAVPGVWFGSRYVSLADPGTVRQLIGIASFMAGIMQLSSQLGYVRVRSMGRLARVAPLAGLIVGLVASTTNAHGVVLAVYLMQLGLTKEEFVAMTSVNLGVVESTRLLAYYVHGIGGTSNLIMPVLFAPLIWVGGWVGYRLNRLLPRRVFFVILALFVSGIGLLLVVR